MARRATGALTLARLGLLLLPALLLALLLAPAASATAQDMARVVTHLNKPDECISSVTIRRINGQEQHVPPQGFKLPPGRHSLSGIVALDTRVCEVVRGPETVPPAPLEADFEAGKTYYIGFDHSSANRQDWGYVIWNVE